MFFIQWDFLKDGTFHLEIEDPLNSERKEGIWDLTKDGKHLELHFKNDQQGMITRTTVLDILELSYDDLSLVYTTLPPIFHEVFCRNNSLFYTRV